MNTITIKRQHNYDEATPARPATTEIRDTLVEAFNNVDEADFHVMIDLYHGKMMLEELAHMLLPDNKELYDKCAETLERLRIQEWNDPANRLY